jgi:hypothetical protein
VDLDDAVILGGEIPCENGDQQQVDGSAEELAGTVDKAQLYEV